MATANDLQDLEKAVWKDLGIEKDGKGGYGIEVDVGGIHFESILDTSSQDIQTLAALMKTDTDEMSWDSGVDSDKPTSPQIQFTDLQSAVAILPSLSEFESVDYVDPGNRVEEVSVVALGGRCSGGSVVQRADKIGEVTVTMTEFDGVMAPVVAKRSTPRRSRRTTPGLRSLERPRTVTESTDESPLLSQAFDVQVGSPKFTYEIQWGNRTPSLSDGDEGSSEYGDSGSGRNRWEDRFDSRPPKKRRYEEAPSTDPNVEKSRKNAIIAKRNRDKKKQRMEELESKVAALQSMNLELKRENKRLNETVVCLDDQVVYLKSVISNETSIGPILSQIQGCFAPRLSRSFDTSISMANGEMLPKPQPIGGVCIHVDGSNVSLEMCSACSKMSAGAPHKTGS